VSGETRHRFARLGVPQGDRAVPVSPRDESAGGAECEQSGLRHRSFVRPFASGLGIRQDDAARLLSIRDVRLETYRFGAAPPVPDGAVKTGVGGQAEAIGTECRGSLRRESAGFISEFIDGFRDSNPRSVFQGPHQESVWMRCPVEFGHQPPAVRRHGASIEPGAAFIPLEPPQGRAGFGIPPGECQRVLRFLGHQAPSSGIEGDDGGGELESAPDAGAGLHVPRVQIAAHGKQDLAAIPTEHEFVEEIWPRRGRFFLA